MNHILAQENYAAEKDNSAELSPAPADDGYLMAQTGGGHSGRIAEALTGEENAAHFSARGRYEQLLKHCTLCPRHCGVDRLAGQTGFCGAGEPVRVALVSLHPWEEPCLVGEKGAGTVFFSGCNLRCVFCQNSVISSGGQGEEVSVERLAEIFLEQEERGAATLDLVTPTHYAPQIAAALTLAKARGLTLPVVWNSGGYETAETVGFIAPLIDIFLPDLKYYSAETAGAYSKAPDYFAMASAAITRMVKEKGPLQFGADGRLQRGVIVRHLVLPGHRRESMALVKWLWQSFGDSIQLSLMSQYTPMYRAKEIKPLNRRLTTFEYQSVVSYAQELGITRCYVQERTSAKEEYVPDFDGSGVRKGV